MTNITSPAGDRERTELLPWQHSAASYAKPHAASPTSKPLQRTTPSELCLAGIVKHVTAAWQTWLDFTQNGAPSKGTTSLERKDEHAKTFMVLPRGDCRLALGPPRRGGTAN